MRLDRAMAARGLARSRTHAQQLIHAATVRVDGEVVTRPATDVPDRARIDVAGDLSHYVSRAAAKLIGALDACATAGLEVAHRTALDAGASTGGFTQVLLERGVAHVHAVDVGHGQLDPRIAADPRVSVYEGTNVRDLHRSHPVAGVDLVVADLSFIGLPVVIPALAEICAIHADALLMVKPQFESGPAALSSRGVVEDPRVRVRAVQSVAQAMMEAGMTIHQVSRSVLPGPQGNVEYFVWGSTAWQARGRQHGDRPVLTGDVLSAAIIREVEGSHLT